MENSAFGESKQADFPAHTCILFFFSSFLKKTIGVRKSAFNEKTGFEKQLEKNLHRDLTEAPSFFGIVFAILTCITGKLNK